MLVGLDIGTAKVATIVAAVDDNDEIEIVGIGTSQCGGLKKGVVGDIVSVARADDGDGAEGGRGRGAAIPEFRLGNDVAEADMGLGSLVQRQRRRIEVHVADVLRRGGRPGKGVGLSGRRLLADAKTGAQGLLRGLQHGERCRCQRASALRRTRAPCRYRR